MADRTGTRRVFIDDVRRDGKFLRATWHQEERTYVVSTWDGNVCTGAVRLDTAGSGELIQLLADGLVSAAAGPAVRSTPARRTGWPGLLRKVRGWIRRPGPSEVPSVRWADDQVDRESRSA